MVTCIICFDQFGSDAVYKTASCMHYSCQSCLASYFLAYQEPPKYDYTIIPCPMPGCPRTFKAHPAINQVLNAEQAQDWWHNAIEKSTLDNIGPCPYQDCTGVFIISSMVTCSLYAIFSRIFFPWFKDENKCYARCIKCSRGICVKCGLAWHLKSERCFKKSRAEKKRDSNQDTQSMDIRLADAQFKELSRKEGWTQCPYCGYVVCKSNGCYIVRCRCGKEFCYRCGSKSKKHNCSRKCHFLHATVLKRHRRINTCRSQ